MADPKVPGSAAVNTALVVLTAARCVDRVLWTRLSFAYAPFLWYLSNMILPIAFIVTSWPVVWYKLYFTNDITPEMRNFPQYKFAIMGLLDTIFNLLSTFPTPHLGGDLINILSQMVLPINMAMAACFLGTTYRRNHILGAILIIYGVAINFLPVIEGREVKTVNGAYFWTSIYLVSLLPAAASNVYKEIGLKDVDMDLWYANAWTCFWQIIYSMVTVWTIQVPGFADPPISWTDFPAYISNSHKCFMGEPVHLKGNGDEADTVMHCENFHILVLFLFFIIFNMVYNQLMLYVFKYGGSVMFVISSAICLPLTDILYMIPWLAGPQATETFTIYDGFALFVMVIALLVYYSAKEVGEDEAHKQQERSPAWSSPSMNRLKSFVKKKFAHTSTNVFRLTPPSLARPQKAGASSLLGQQPKRKKNDRRGNSPSSYGSFAATNRGTQEEADESKGVRDKYGLV